MDNARPFRTALATTALTLAAAVILPSVAFAAPTTTEAANAAAASRPAEAPSAIESVRVMEFNIWNGGTDPDTGRDGNKNLAMLTQLITKQKPDILMVAEAGNSGPGIADALTKATGVPYSEVLTSGHGSQYSNSIVTKYKVRKTFPAVVGLNPDKFAGGVQLELGNGKKVNVFAAHPTASPNPMVALKANFDAKAAGKPLVYSTKQLARVDAVTDLNQLSTGVASDTSDSSSAPDVTPDSRVDQLTKILSAIKSATADDASVPTMLIGDFNALSAQDWSKANSFIDSHQNLAVNWQATRAILDAGFIDSYRKINPSVKNNPGETYGALLYPQPAPDRIDYIWFKGASVDTVNSTVVSETPSDGGNFYSDHLPLVSTMTVK